MSAFAETFVIDAPPKPGRLTLTLNCSIFPTYLATLLLLLFLLPFAFSCSCSCSCSSSLSYSLLSCNSAVLAYVLQRLQQVARRPHRLLPRDRRRSRCRSSRAGAALLQHSAQKTPRRGQSLGVSSWHTLPVLRDVWWTAQGAVSAAASRKCLASTKWCRMDAVADEDHNDDDERFRCL